MKKKVLVLITAVVALALVAYFVLPGLLYKIAIDSERRAAGLQQKKVMVGDHEIVYLEGGSGEAIIMVHGFGINKDCWTSFAKFITPDFRVIALDVPGFGDSTYLENASYSIAEQAKRVNQFADAIGLQKFHIVGNSMGGAIAARYAVMFPERVVTLGLFNAFGVSSPVQSEFYRILSRGESNPLIFESIEGFDRLMSFVFLAPPDIPRFVKKLVVEDAQKHKASNERIGEQIISEKEALEPDLPKIKTPTLVLWGDQDRILDVSSVQVLQNGLPNSTAVIIKYCGHDPMEEKPQEAAEHYLTFLKSK